MYFSARTEGRISYGHFDRTNSCFDKEQNSSIALYELLLRASTIHFSGVADMKRCEAAASDHRWHIFQKIELQVILQNTTRRSNLCHFCLFSFNLQYETSVVIVWFVLPVTEEVFLFRTSDMSVIKYCQEMFHFKLPSITLQRRSENFEMEHCNVETVN